MKLSDEDIADFEVLRDVVMATIFRLSIYGVHIGVTEPCICGGDAALCQITLTTCYLKLLLVFPLIQIINLKKCNDEMRITT